MVSHSSNVAKLLRFRDDSFLFLKQLKERTCVRSFLSILYLSIEQDQCLHTNVIYWVELSTSSVTINKFLTLGNLSQIIVLDLDQPLSSGWSCFLVFYIFFFYILGSKFVCIHYLKDIPCWRVLFRAWFSFNWMCRESGV